MIYTPRGLKIDIDLNHALALMQRLRFKIHPFKFMCNVEAVGYIPGLMFILACLAGFILDLDIVLILVIAVSCHLLASILNILGLFIIPFSLKFCSLIRVPLGYLIPQLLIYSYGAYKIGIFNIIMIIVIQVFYSGLMGFVSAKITKLIYKRIISSPIRDFLNLYSYFALRNKLDPNWNVTEDELFDNDLMKLNEELLKFYKKVK